MITQNELKERLDYDPETGIFRWKKCNKKELNGQIAGNEHHSYNRRTSYTRIGIAGNLYQAHRLAWLYIYGEFPRQEIDHINGNGYDNRAINLRCTNRQENGRNIKRSSNNKSGVTGVCWIKRNKKWNVRIKNNNNRYLHLGYFSTIEEAILVRKQAELRYNYHPNHGKE